MKSFLKIFSPAVSVPTSCLTWEWMTTYDKVPLERDLRLSFEGDFPVTVMKMKSSGGFYDLLPLTSFNSPEGRRLRFLAVIAESTVNTNRFCRCLPQQIWLYGAADSILRKEADCGGNALLYYHEGRSLTAMIFFEGRLCHWIEESGYTNADLVDCRINQIRNFLKKDSLFACERFYEVINIENYLSEKTSKKALFKKAAKDPLWKNVDLQLLEKRFQNMNPLRKKKSFLCVSLIIVAMVLFCVGDALKFVKQNTLNYVTDVAPPELTEIELVEAVENNPFEKNILEKGILKESLNAQKCGKDLPSIQGIVSDRLVLSNGNVYGVGDSIGLFKVQKITRSGMSVSCENTTYFVGIP